MSLHPLLEIAAENERVHALAGRACDAANGGEAIAVPASGMLRPLLLATLLEDDRGLAGRPALLVAADDRSARDLAADLRADNIAVNCLSPSRVVLTEGWQAGGLGMQIPPEMVEPPEAMADAAVLLAGQDAAGITGTVQRSEDISAR